MCVKCSIREATNAGDWKEVKRLATEADKGKHDDEFGLPADATLAQAQEAAPPSEDSAESK